LPLNIQEKRLEAFMKKLSSVCLITPDVPGLSDFYQRVLEVAPEGDDVFVSFSISGAKLSIFPIQALDEMIPGLMDDSGRGNCFLEFEVDDVDLEYERLQELNVKVVKPPTTQPWGIRSVWFLDPDGNKVNFFAWVGSKESGA
jgi:catechol 2,3-dioxygenase-like lactoylglutathione lyase family enzyme